MGNRWLAAAGLAAVTMIAAACGSSGSGNSGNSGNTAGSGGGGSSASTGTTGSGGSAAIDAHRIGGKLVLTNAKGFTLYWFAADKAGKSNCDASCIQYWPPVKGPATAGPGVTGKLGTTTRSDGTTQATYNGHPLYTYVGDTAPGQDKGNGLNISGGLWYVVPVSGKAAPTPTKSSGSGGGGGGGYGY